MPRIIRKIHENVSYKEKKQIIPEKNVFFY